MKVFEKMIDSGRNDVQDAVLQCYIQTPTELFRWKNRPAVVICAGGAYSFTNDRESEPIALMFMSQGFQAFSLRYSCQQGIYPVALEELARSVIYVREHAEELSVDPERIMIAGFSAGGHLAAQYCCVWRHLLEPTEWRKKQPNACVLGYPVITSRRYTHEESMRNLLGDQDCVSMREQVSVERLVTKDVPPTFIWHTRTDPAVSVFNSLLYAEALTSADVPYELHIYPYGGHGLSLSARSTTGEDRHINGYCTEWTSEMKRFLDVYLHLEIFDQLQEVK